MLRLIIVCLVAFLGTAMADGRGRNESVSVQVECRNKFIELCAKPCMADSSAQTMRDCISSCAKNNTADFEGCPQRGRHDRHSTNRTHFSEGKARMWDLLNKTRHGDPHEAKKNVSTNGTHSSEGKARLWDLLNKTRHGDQHESKKNVLREIFKGRKLAQSKDNKPSNNKDDTPSNNKGDKPSNNKGDKPSNNKGDKPSNNKDDKPSNDNRPKDNGKGHGAPEGNGTHPSESNFGQLMKHPKFPECVESICSSCMTGDKKKSLRACQINCFRTSQDEFIDCISEETEYEDDTEYEYESSGEYEYEYETESDWTV